MTSAELEAGESFECFFEFWDALLASGIAGEKTGEKVAKVELGMKSGNGLCNSSSERGYFVPNFFQQRGPAIQKGDDILQIMACPGIPMSSIPERVQFAGEKDCCGNHGDLQTLHVKPPCIRYAMLKPGGRELSGNGGGGKNVHEDVVLQPAATGRVVGCVVAPTRVSKPRFDFLIVEDGCGLNHDIDIPGGAHNDQIRVIQKQWDHRASRECVGKTDLLQLCGDPSEGYDIILPHWRAFL